ncbi:hypothetical protein AB9Q04_04290 [Anaerococcus sp. ENR1011]|uniref:Lactate/malate dehydrogenase N-terminal domain-containing protein n=1 Tax=Anaerococcus groningensis TaxID=3115616 RepID=A0ABW9N0D6_9FIRM
MRMVVMGSGSVGAYIVSIYNLCSNDFNNQRAFVDRRLKFI